MPSIFTRHRASDGMPPEEKRRSLDTVRGLISEKSRRLSSASQTFDESKGSLRKRLSSASQIFHKAPEAPDAPTSPFNPNFSMAAESSSWQPSYPTVIDDVAPQSENERRRSIVTPRAMPTPSPDEVPRQVTPPSIPAPLPTPPPIEAKRPEIPSRRTTLIQSPPMPQPIQNLPTMVGWPAFMKDGIPGTPGWGQLAREGGPKTPGFSGARTPGYMSPRVPGTPVTGGFPFSLPPTPVGQNKGKGREVLSDEELRKARRAMVSISLNALTSACHVAAADDSSRSRRRRSGRLGRRRYGFGCGGQWFRSGYRQSNEEVPSFVIGNHGG